MKTITARWMLLRKLNDQRILHNLHSMELEHSNKGSLHNIGLNYLQKESNVQGGFYPYGISSMKTERIRQAFETSLEKQDIGKMIIVDRKLRNWDFGDLLKHNLSNVHDADKEVMDIEFDFEVGKGSQPKDVDDKDFTEPKTYEDAN